jgi:wyosine [tRNA(Phe)-imidazoG37] synthetase (radical SAM superfamily)
MKIIYGPVSSWRLGSSLGIDLFCSEKKICSFDCIYCQLGKQPNKTTQRKNFISIKEMEKELARVLEKLFPDVITFSGLGEPTLAKNMDLAIETIKKITNIPLAVLTNSTLMKNKKVQKTLLGLDIVVAKLDASNEKLFQEINQPAEVISFNETVKGIKNFNEKFSGKLDIQIMFIKNNMGFAEEIADIVNEIKPDEVQINTPLRPCAVKPLDEEQLAKIEKIFIEKGLKTTSVYTSTKPKTAPMDKIEIFKRRGINK